MKLIFAIVHDEDTINVMDELNANGFMVTKLCSSGGFLKAGNTTLFAGVDDDKVDAVLSIIEKKSKSRKQIATSAIHTGGTAGQGMYMSYPVEVTVGGATVFIIDNVEFRKF